MVKTFFIKLKKKVLLRDKTVILKDLSAGKGKLIKLIINNDGNNNLRKNVTPEKFINNLIISDSNPEILKINHHGVKLKVNF